MMLDGWHLTRMFAKRSTLTALPDDDFPDLCYVALMFAWSDIETREGLYDFTLANRAYDYWRVRGKRLHLRMSTASLLWWDAAGLRAPKYVLDKLGPDEKQTREAVSRDRTYGWSVVHDDGLDSACRFARHGSRR